MTQVTAPSRSKTGRASALIGTSRRYQRRPSRFFIVTWSHRRVPSPLFPPKAANPCLWLPSASTGTSMTNRISILLSLLAAAFLGFALLADSASASAPVQVNPPLSQATIPCGTTSDQYDMTSLSASSSGQSSEANAINSALNALSAQVGKCGFCPEPPHCGQINFWEGTISGVVIESGSGTWSAWLSGEEGLFLTIACRQCPT